MANSGAPPRRHFLPRPSAMCNGGRMRSLLYSINVTLDGCVDHAGSGVIPDQELHERSAETIAAADALIFGRITYQMMEEAWRPVAAGEPADWVEDWMRPFARTIDGAKKYVVTQTLRARRLERRDHPPRRPRSQRPQAQGAGRWTAAHRRGPPAPHPRPARTGRRVRVRRASGRRGPWPPTARRAAGTVAAHPHGAHRLRLRRRRPPVCREDQCVNIAAALASASA